jgi:glycerol-3-phosphate acyltransferase PlsX
MAEHTRISVDAMGGDRGPAVVLPGLAIVLERCPDQRFDLFGDEAVLRPLLDAHESVKAATTLHHAPIAIGMDDKPSQALRVGRWKSSMWLTLDHVKKGGAGAAVSAGNTGALMALAKFCLRTMEHVNRPALAAIWPTIRGESIVLDVGATVGADTDSLVTYAILGGAMARAVYGLERPTVGLLNIGVEEVKGLEQVRSAHQILRSPEFTSFTYHGFVEGDDIGKGTVDVVVTEGFSGNIALKTAEGTARQVSRYLRDSFRRTWRARLGYLLARPAFRRLKEKMDPRKVNVAVFLGLNGLVIKSHGGTDAEGFAAAIEAAYDMVKNELQMKIASDVASYREAARLADAS